MLYLNPAIFIKKGCVFYDLTLTNVVFESCINNGKWINAQNLTLTNVVFE